MRARHSIAMDKDHAEIDVVSITISPGDRVGCMWWDESFLFNLTPAAATRLHDQLQKVLVEMNDAGVVFEDE